MARIKRKMGQSEMGLLIRVIRAIRGSIFGPVAFSVEAGGGMLADSKVSAPSNTADCSYLFDVKRRIGKGWAALAASTFLLAVSSCATAAAAGPEFLLSTATLRDVASLLEPIRARLKLPALAVMVIRSNAVVGSGVVGQRKWGVSEPVTLADKWHQGSITKSMTATLAALLVQDGRLHWDTPLGEVFAGRAAAMHPQWRTVTLEQLLSHRGGAPDMAWLEQQHIWGQAWNFGGTPWEARRLLLDQVTAQAPPAKPGSQYIYSNAGYAFAGAMLEEVMKHPWEELITERLFGPLGMASAGFGVPATPRYINQPWGHVFTNGVPSPVAPGPDADNPPAIGPAGTVHCSAPDLARYVGFQLSGARGEPGLLLRPESFSRLHHDPDGDGYALGWNEGRRDWAQGRTLSHTGSNNQWYSNVWLAPERNWACLVLTNIGGDAAFSATDAVVEAMIAQFRP